MQSEKFTTKYQISGYGGLTYLKSKIIQYIPKNIKFWCEPFAGLGRISELIQSEKMVLNDTSDYAISILRDKFSNSIITQEDFMDCIKRNDSNETFFFCDPPWRKNIYKNHQRPSFTKQSTKDYYDDLLSILPKCKGDWIITSDRDEHEIGTRLSGSGFPNLLLEADEPTPKFYGRVPAVRLCSKTTLHFNQSTQPLFGDVM